MAAQSNADVSVLSRAEDEAVFRTPKDEKKVMPNMKSPVELSVEGLVCTDRECSQGARDTRHLIEYHGKADIYFTQ
jgi:hypothetical protein